MDKRKWTRPNLPPEQRLNVLLMGAFLFVAGSSLIIWAINSLGEPDQAILRATVGFGCTQIGLLLICLGAVLGEIRQAAFEAALRAGEVELDAS